AGRYDAESVERLHAPLQELIARVVPLELDLHVELQRVRTIGEINLYGVIDHQIDRNERLDDAGVLIEARRGRAHCRQIDQQWHAREVLQQDARDHERDLFGPLGPGLPLRERADVVFRDFLSVDVAENRFEDDADADRQTRDRAK